MTDNAEANPDGRDAADLPSFPGDDAPVDDFGAGLLRGDPACCDLADAVPDGIYVLDTEGRFRFVNRAIEERSGMPRDRFYQATYLDVVLEKDHELARANFERVMAGEASPPYTLDYAADGGTLTVEVNSRPIREGGEVVGLLGVSRDVTRRRQAEQERRHTARQLALILDCAAEHIVFHDPSHRMLWTSRAAADSVGATPEELRGRHCYEVWHQRDTPCEGCPVVVALKTGEPRRAKMTTPDGRVWDVRAHPAHDDEGTLVGVVEVTIDVTDRERAEQALRQSEATYRALVEASPDAVAATDLDFHLLAASDQAYTTFGYAKTDEVLGRSILGFFRPEDVPRLKKNFEATLHEGLTRNIEYTMVRKDGSEFVGEINAAAIRGPEGDIRGVIATIRDVTDRKRAEEALRQNEANYRAIFNAVHDMVFVHDIDTGDVVDMNHRAAEAYGCEPGDLDRLNARFRRRRDSPYAYADQKQWLRKAAEEGPQLFEWLAEDRHGRQFWVEVGVRRATIGGAERLLAVLRNISGRKRAEEALRESEARYRAVVEAQTELVCRFRPDHTLTFVNEAYARYFGKSQEELVGTDYAPLIVEEDRERVRRTLGAISADNPVATVEERVLRPDGEVRWQQWISRGIFDEAGRLVEMQGVGRDITERKRAEEALRRSEEDYRLLFEQSVDGIVVVADGRIVRANRAFADIHGRAVEDLLNTPSTDLLQPDERAPAAQRIRGILDGTLRQTGSRQYHALRADGSVALVEYRSRRILWKGRPAVQTIVRDITQQVRLQEQLQQAMKMEAVGQLAGGIAHDFNNLMTGILCHAGLLKTETGVSTAVRQTADLIEGAARRAAELTSQLLGFARRGKQQDVPVDLVATVETSVRLLSQSLTPTVTVETDFRTPHAYVRGDPVQMEQVVLNLAMNARDAMPDGGTVTFTIVQQEVTPEACTGHAHAQPGPSTLLTVADTGVGIPEEQHSRVFEPFFTTKPQGKGTGMGLAMVYGIVRNHEGWIDVESEPGRGTAFRVYFPAAEAPAEGETPPASAAAVEVGADRGRILVVDDEELVRDVVSRMLERLGYEGVAVASGREAVDYYEESGGEVAAVLIDVRMPGMDGRECFRALKAIDPHVRAVLATGGGAGDSLQDLLDEGVAALVKKPFEIGGLDAVLRRVLGG